MKTTRKILALILTAALCFALIAPAFADDPTPTPTMGQPVPGGNSGPNLPRDNSPTPIPNSASASTFQIVIDNAVDGETYKAYNIFYVSYTNPSPTAVAAASDIPGSPDPNQQYSAYAYTILDTSDWWDVVTHGEDPDRYRVGEGFAVNGLRFTKTTVSQEWNVIADERFDAAAFAALLRDNMPNPEPEFAARVTAHATDSATGVSPSYTANMSNVVSHDGGYKTGIITLDVTDYGAGYYFVDTSMGSLCSLDTTENIATIREKNSVPTQVKTVSDNRIVGDTDSDRIADLTAKSETFSSSASASIGDVVTFRIVITDGIGTDGTLTVHDTMSDGLTLVSDSFHIYTNTGTNNALEEISAGGNTYSTKPNPKAPAAPKDGCTFEIVFAESFIANLADSKVITITYEATVNNNAVIAGTGNPNSSKVTYANQETPTSTATVYTYAGAIYKFDGATGNELAGATFAVTAVPLSEPTSGAIIPSYLATPTPRIPSTSWQPTLAPASPRDDDVHSIGGNVAKRGVLNGATSQPVLLVQISAGSDTAPAVYQYKPNDPRSSNIITTPASGAVVLLGFAQGTVLTLTEIEAPTGYNLLAAPVTLTINATSTDTVDQNYSVGNVTVTFVSTGTQLENEHPDDNGKQIHADSIVFIENNSGSELPSTGGIGTKIFMIGGSILVLAAGVFLVAMSVSKRRSEEN